MPERHYPECTISEKFPGTINLAEPLFKGLVFTVSVVFKAEITENGASSPKKGSGGFVRGSDPRLIIPACRGRRSGAAFDLLFLGNPGHALVTVSHGNSVCVALRERVQLWISPPPLSFTGEPAPGSGSARGT